MTGCHPAPKIGCSICGLELLKEPHCACCDATSGKKTGNDITITLQHSRTPPPPASFWYRPQRFG